MMAKHRAAHPHTQMAEIQRALHALAEQHRTPADHHKNHGADEVDVQELSQRLN
jgi:hypothetical protein